MQARYSAANQLLHWVTGVCMLAIVPLAWVMTNAKNDTPGLGAMYNWHKTLGLIVLLATAFRIVWRFIDKPPAYPPSIARWDRALAHATYSLFYLTLLWMPITGLVMSAYEGHPTKLFNLIPTPELVAKNDKIADLFGNLHGLGQWAVYGLILLHIAGVVFHLVVKKDGTLGRMLPEQALEG